MSENKNSKAIRVAQDVVDFLDQHGSFGDSYNKILRRLLGIEPQEQDESDATVSGKKAS